MVADAALRGIAGVQRLDSISQAADVLEMEEAGFSIDGRTLLAPTSLAFGQGRVYGIIGHNGSGKSTLLKLISRQMEPTRGEIRLGKRPISTFGARDFARHVAYLPQHPPIGAGLTVREVVSFGRYPWHGLLGRPGHEDAVRIAEAERLAHVDTFSTRLIDTLSGGERQRAWIAMLLAQNSRFILLDEPISALDLAHQIEVLRFLHELSRTRMIAVVTILHDINMAARFCDELIALHSGTIRAHGAPDDIIRPDVLEMIYGIPMGVVRHPVSGAPIGFAR